MARSFALVLAASLLACTSALPQSSPTAPGGTGSDAGSVASDSGSGTGPQTAPDAGPFDGGVTGIDTPVIDDGVRCSASAPKPSFDVGCGSWTLEQPLPQAHSLKAVWAVATDDVWAVGDSGAILHWDGTSWTAVRSPTSANLNAVWGADPKHVWAGGAGVLLFSDGTTWSVQTIPTSDNISFITGTASDDVWVRGDSPHSLFHWDGVDWTQPGNAAGAPANGSLPIWAAGGGRAWAGGCSDGKASLYSWDGTQWSQTDMDVPGCVGGIAGTSPTDIWASVPHWFSCGYKCSNVLWSTLHWDGSRWSVIDLGTPIGSDIFAPARGEVWFKSGRLFSRLEAGAFHPFLRLVDGQIDDWAYPLGLAAASPSDVTIVGGGGLIAHFDGSAIRLLTGPHQFLYFIWDDASGNAWAGGEKLMRRQNGCWSTVHPALPELANTRWYRMAGSGPNDAWMIAADNFAVRAVHWDGQTFSTRNLPNKGTYYSTVWVSPGGRAFFSGDSGIYRAETVGVSQIDTPDPAVTWLSGKFGDRLWGTSDSDVWWLKGDSATGTTALVHFDGSSPTIAGHLPWPLWATEDIQVAAPDDAWAIVAGRPNTLEHFDGVSATDVTPGPNVFGLAVRARNDVWASASDGLWHFDGRSWAREDRPAGFVVATGGSIYSLENGAICRKP